MKFSYILIFLFLFKLVLNYFLFFFLDDFYDVIFVIKKKIGGNCWINSVYYYCCLCVN